MRWIGANVLGSAGWAMIDIPDQLRSAYNNMRFFLILASMFAAGFAAAAEKPLAVPSDARAQYVVLEKDGRGAERTIVTKRSGTSGVSFAKRLYNCTDSTVKYIGSGDTLAGMAASRPDPRMAPIVDGSIAYFIGLEACR